MTDIEIIIKALENQIAKKPDKTLCDKNGVTVERCPTCYSMMILEYCAKCGQKIDWSE